MVSGASARPRQSGLALAGVWHARDPACRPYSRSSDEMSAPTHARSGGISERLRHSFGEQVSPGSSLSIDCPRRRENCELRTSRVTNWNLWRQLQLARSGLVSYQLSAHRVTPAVPSLLWRRFQGRISDPLRSLFDIEGSRQRTIKPSDQALAPQ